LETRRRKVDLREEKTIRAGVDRQRWRLLLRVEHWLDGPMIALGLLWLALLVIELTRGLSPFLERLSLAIWIAFLIDFAIRFTVAPRKLLYLRRNLLTLVALILPGLRVLRFARVLRAARGIRLVRVLTSLNRGMRALGGTMRRRGFGYVLGLTVLVTLGGAAGMYAFESPASGGGLRGYGDALWWTAMIMTSLGSEYWPHTPEGRILAFLVAVYAVAVFGYITATLASYFIGRDAQSTRGEIAGEAAIRDLRREIAALRAELAARKQGE
jgi:voltage-gated potassium channel